MFFIHVLESKSQPNRRDKELMKHMRGGREKAEGRYAIALFGLCRIITKYEISRNGYRAGACTSYNRDYESVCVIMQLCVNHSIWKVCCYAK